MRELPSPTGNMPHSYGVSLVGLWRPNALALRAPKYQPASFDAAMVPTAKATTTSARNKTPRYWNNCGSVPVSAKIMREI